jgi:hypothetical protein
LENSVFTFGVLARPDGSHSQSSLWWHFPHPVAILNGASIRRKLPDVNDKDDQQLLFLSMIRFSKPVKALN